MLENHYAGADISIQATPKNNTQPTIYDDFLQSCAMSITLKHIHCTFVHDIIAAF